MIYRTVHVLAALALLSALGCASTFVDPTGKKNSLEIAQREYTKMIRWGEIRRAAVFVELDMLEEFLGYAESFEHIRVTDADYDAQGVIPHEDHAEVEVTYHAYSLATLEEKQIKETQVWSRYDGVKNTWRVRPEIASIVAAFAPRVN